MNRPERLVSLELRKAVPHDRGGYLVVESATGRLLAGVGHNPHRAWVFPLNTPHGRNVVQEHAFDHPFHNGVFVGQGKVVSAGTVTNFWAPHSDWRQPDNPIFHHIGALQYGEPAEIGRLERGFRFTYTTVWRDEHDRPVLDEVRTLDIYDGGDATICDVRSTKTAAYGPVEFATSKHGSIGIRVQPQLLPVLGGQIMAVADGELLRGGADEVANGLLRDQVAYEADVPGLGRFGVAVSVLENSADQVEFRGPWFIRDYGLATFNATMRSSIQVPAGGSWVAGLRVVAYDEAFRLDRAKAWQEDL